MQAWRPKEPPPEPQPRFLPAPDEIRALVLDYLCHNAFTGTARAFIRDSAVRQLDADGDEVMSASDQEDPGVDLLAQSLEERLVLAQRRKEVRTRILAGDIDGATTLLNGYFPSVLSEDHDILPDSSDSSQEEPLLRYIPSTSVDPTHLALNLRIQAFIEASRTVPLPDHLPGASAPSLPPSPTRHTQTPRSTADDQTVADELLHRAQSLYAEAQCLTKPNDRAHYLEELGQVGALLVYPEPERSPMAVYLSQERREAVADQIDSAILFRLNKLPISKIELMARYTTTVFDVARELDIKPPNLQIPFPWGSYKSARNKLSADGSPLRKSGKDVNEVPFPSFNLAEYLDSKP